MIAKPCRTDQKLYSSAGVVLRGPVYECLDNPIPELGHLEEFGVTHDTDVLTGTRTVFIPAFLSLFTWSLVNQEALGR